MTNHFTLEAMLEDAAMVRARFHRKYKMNGGGESQSWQPEEVVGKSVDIMKALEGGPLLVREIADAIGLKTTSVRTYLTKLKNMGKVHVVDEVKLPDAPRPQKVWALRLAGEGGE